MSPGRIGSFSAHYLIYMFWENPSVYGYSVWLGDQSNIVSDLENSCGYEFSVWLGNQSNTGTNRENSRGCEFSVWPGGWLNNVTILENPRGLDSWFSASQLVVDIASFRRHSLIRGRTATSWSPCIIHTEIRKVN